MDYLKFIISNYRAINGPLVIDVEKNPLIPIIGVNESGKTTILQAIFAFDYWNDDFNEGRQLIDTSNLYDIDSAPATITAELSTTKDDYVGVIKSLLDENKADAARTLALTQYMLKLTTLPLSFKISITRNLKSLEYTIENENLTHEDMDDLIARGLIINNIPFTLYFDDFRDSVDDRIEIKESEKDSTAGWLAIVEQLFSQTDESFSVFKLASLEERQRKSVLARVTRYLNATLTKEWQRFRLDEVDALKIAIEFETETFALEPVDNEPQVGIAAIKTKTLVAPKTNTESQSVITKRHFLKFELIETDVHENEHYFYIRDRSKGFFWFFNFVMKLEFNPRVLNNASNTIYLLDEPGSYLHASAQSKLCSKLKQLSEKNRVVYCTHSHYLLDPSVIPLSSIKVADKDGLGNITLIPIHEHKGNILDRRSAFQPVIDALQIKPFLLDLTQNRVIITEGIYDYYALEMFKNNRDINILPSVGADSISYYVSLMIAWQVNFHALWDNDEAGRAAYKKATKHFGEEISKKHFNLIPLTNTRTKKRILQDLFVGTDLRDIKNALSLPSNSSFQKTMTSLFYSQNKSVIIKLTSEQTKQNFNHLFEAMSM